MKRLPVLLILMGFCGCSKNAGFQTGNYNGTVTRMSPTDIPIQSAIRLEIDGKRFTGYYSKNDSLFASGTYLVSGAHIRFQSEDSIPTNGSSFLIPNGSYDLLKEGDSLVFRTSPLPGQNLITVNDFRLRRE